MSFVSNLYKDASGRIIVEYYVSGRGSGRVLFYDFEKGLLDTPEQSASFSNSNAALFAFRRSHDWRRLDRGLDNDSYVIQQWSLNNAPRCQCPYGGYTSLTGPDGRTESVTLFRRLDHPEVSTFDIWCESGPGRVSLSFKYQLVAADVYDAEDGTFFLLFDRLPYVIHLAANLTINTSHDTDKLVSVSTDVADRYCRDLEQGTMPAQQAVDRMEIEIARASGKENSSNDTG
jgi:hypothetical protein